jgi:hypothetical protein
LGWGLFLVLGLVSGMEIANEISIHESRLARQTLHIWEEIYQVLFGGRKHGCLFCLAFAVYTLGLALVLIGFPALGFELFFIHLYDHLLEIRLLLIFWGVIYWALDCLEFGFKKRN